MRVSVWQQNLHRHRCCSSDGTVSNFFCLGCTLYDQKIGTKTKGGLVWYFYCNCYLTVPLKSTDNFVPGKCTKVGAIKESVKGRGEPKRRWKLCIRMHGEFQDEIKTNFADRRGRKTLVSKDNSKKQPTKRTDGLWSKDVDWRYHMHASLLFSEIMALVTCYPLENLSTISIQRNIRTLFC